MDPKKSFEILEGLILCIALVFGLMGSQGYSPGDAADSRLATVFSLTHDGTWYIDRPPDQPPNPFEQRTIDKVAAKGRLVSSKPPMFTLLMLGEYVGLNRTVGWSLLPPGDPIDPEDKSFEENDDDIRKTVRFMTITLVGIPYFLAVLFFAKTVRLFVADAFARVVLVFCAAFCSQLWGYSSTITNHVPAAAAIGVAIYYALGLGSGKLAPAPWRFAVFGLAAGLTPTLDLPGSIFPFMAGVYLLAKFPAKTAAFAAPVAAIPLAIQSAILFSVTGSPLPVQLHKEAYLYETSYWRSPMGVDALNEPKGLYAFHMLLGRCGVFSLYPILLAGVAGSIRAVRRNDLPQRGAILAGASGFAVLTLYYIFKTNNYGGEAYGFRWYIVSMPILLMMGAPVIASLRVRWKWIFVMLTIAVSFYSGFECARSPWGANRQWTCRFLGPTYGPVLSDREREDAFREILGKP